MQPFLIGSYPDAGQKLTQGLPSSEITVAEVFAAMGYDTAILGKWHLGYGWGNLPQRCGVAEQYGFLEAFSLYAEEFDSNIVNYHHDLFWERHIRETGRSGPSAITRNAHPVSETRYLTDAISEETRLFIDHARAR